MNKIENLYLSMVEEWRTKAKGNGMINFGPRINYIPVVLGILQQVYNKNPTAKVIVLTNNKNQKDNLITYITSTNDVENNKTKPYAIYCDYCHWCYCSYLICRFTCKCGCF